MIGTIAFVCGIVLLALLAVIALYTATGTKRIALPLAGLVAIVLALLLHSRYPDWAGFWIAGSGFVLIVLTPRPRAASK